jgi:hypothetical protein
MLKVLRDEELPVVTRLEAARMAAPYVHPRFSTITYKVENESAKLGPIDRLDFARRAAFLLAHPAACGIRE